MLLLLVRPCAESTPGTNSVPPEVSGPNNLSVGIISLDADNNFITHQYRRYRIARAGEARPSSV